MSEADVESIRTDDESLSDHHFGEDEKEPFLPEATSGNELLGGLTLNGLSKENGKANGHRSGLSEQLSDTEEVDEDRLNHNADTTDDDDMVDDFLDKGNEDFVEEQAQKRMAELAAEEKEVASRLRKIENQELDKAKVVQGQRVSHHLSLFSGFAHDERLCIYLITLF